MKNVAISLSILLVSIQSLVNASGTVSIITVPNLGQIKGSVIPFKETPQNYYFQYKAIPYAEPPERFDLAQPIQPWSDIHNGTVEGNICPQPGGDLIYPGAQNEDCLVLTVTTSQDPNNIQSLLPVLVWIHGGAFIIGASHVSYYDPEKYAQENLIVVELNYRLGALGWLTDGIIIPKNIGLKDVRLALEWVQLYIVAFGGDNSRVTINGESAGSAIVSTLWQSPRINGLFSQVFMQSGTSISPWAVQKQPAESFKTIVKGTSSCWTYETTDDQVQCLRNVSFYELNFDTLLNLVVVDLAFFEIIDGIITAVVLEDPADPGAIVVTNPLEQLEIGYFRTDTPLMISITSEEMLTFAPILLEAGLYPNAALVPYGMMATDEDLVGGLIKTHYAGSEDLWAVAPLTTYITAVSDLMTNYPLRRFTELVQQRLGATPVYVFEFGYASEMGRINDRIDKVGHVDDLFYSWKLEIASEESVVGVTYSTETFIKRDQYCRLVGNFVKFGNPTPSPDELLEFLSWPPVSTPESFEYLDFTQQLIIRNRPKDTNYYFWSDLYQAYGNGSVSL